MLFNKIAALEEEMVVSIRWVMYLTSPCDGGEGAAGCGRCPKGGGSLNLTLLVPREQPSEKGEAT